MHLEKFKFCEVSAHQKNNSGTKRANDEQVQ